ncbi:hypothetical protein [Methanimicrococcus blatticola]|uniref:Uncharacterized protein n=1 Tax=Methanimicrococcus blatticola TaxID=91560 RepID=A0A484F451_9EURY|nr:hypothetical protein [Methanimicrococcus blatticola]MBZ3936439.1 hypothetical protein [Methanimicrococcus blatticola]MCC2508226.1 hypothetical protein [Methanimicrococcus blatticola]TDQ67534.1 hypothetical protein C7391_1624 [Methanimicrococcus blatticola]
MNKNHTLIILTIVCLLGLLSCGVAAAATDFTYDLSDGDLLINVTGQDTMTINNNKKSYSISDTSIIVYSSGQTKNVIYINGNNRTNVNTINLALSGVDIKSGDYYSSKKAYKYNPISIVNKAQVNLEIKENTINSLEATDYYAALRVVSGTKLTINGTGTLNVKGGALAAGIGGNAGLDGKSGESTGAIVIDDGTFNVIAANAGVGIGGGAGSLGSFSNN